jgi:hypothetical protein
MAPNNPTPLPPEAEETARLAELLRLSLRVPAPERDRSPFWNVDDRPGGGPPNVPDPPWGQPVNLEETFEHIGVVLGGGAVVPVDVMPATAPKPKKG